MIYRNGNYVAFYVNEPYSESNLGAHATRDFCYYNLLKMWKANDPKFPFIDSHEKTYDVRDGSDFESTLKPRLHERLKKSKNIILFFSKYTANSEALREEIDYGINTCALPVIVIYPDFTNSEEIASNKTFTKEVVNLWNKLPILRENMEKVPTLHILMKKDLIETALGDSGYMVQTKKMSGKYIL